MAQHKSIKDVFLVSDVFAMMRDGRLTQEQGVAILDEIERKPWWWTLMTMFF